MEYKAGDYVNVTRGPHTGLYKVHESGCCLIRVVDSDGDFLIVMESDVSPQRGDNHE